MKKELYQIVIFYEYNYCSKELISNIISDIISSSNYKIDCFSKNDTKFKKFENELDLIKVFFSTPTLLKGNIFLKDSANNVLYQLEYKYNNFIYLNCFIYSEIPIIKIKSTFQQIVKNENAFYGLIEEAKEYKKKHLLTENKGSFVEEKFVGHLFQNGIPGIYTWTYFRNDLFSEVFYKGLTKRKIFENGHLVEKTGLNKSDIKKNLIFNLEEYNVKKELPKALKRFFLVRENIPTFTIPFVPLKKINYQNIEVEKKAGVTAPDITRR